VSRINPFSGAVLKTYGAGRYASGVAFGAGSLWVSDESSNSVARVDPRTGAITQTIPVGSGPRQLAYGDGALWVANSLSSTVSVVDPTTNQERTKILVGQGPNGIAVGREVVWVSVELADEVVRIDPKRDVVDRTIPIGNRPQGVAIHGQGAFVAARSSGQSHRGGTLTVLTTDGYDAFGLPMVEGTSGGLNNGLVTFKRVGGIEGLQLAPDLATSLPTPTDSGRTYTFQLRSGIRYSNGEPLRPEDVRHSIERAIKNGVSFGPIIGADACAQRPKTCDLSRGIVADERANTVAFHLTAPDPYFLNSLAAGIMPASTPDKAVDPSAIPVTGPYKIDSYRANREAILVRNPYFHVWSQTAQPAGFVNRIVFKLNIPDQTAVRMVERGQADLLLAGTLAGAPLKNQVAARYPSQLRIIPKLSTEYLFMNARVPPFNDVRVRRALNYAIDRNLWTTLADPGGRPTCQLLPPAFPGYRPYCPYTVDPGSGTWLGPDLTRAQQLIDASHTKGMHVTVWWGSDFLPNRSFAPHVVALLNQLGYHANLKIVYPDPKNPAQGSFPPYLAAIEDSRNKAQIGFLEDNADYPAAADFLNNLYSCPRSSTIEGFCDPKIKQALALDANAPGTANLLWARIDHEIADQAPDVYLSNPTFAFVVSKRVGNFQVRSGLVPLLDQLWVR
jgi:peptide/nickel transport system substrate-binding protein